MNQEVFNLAKKKGAENSSAGVAENSYNRSDYNSSDGVNKGLAMTHEQVSDTFMEGTIDGEIDDLDSKDKAFPRKRK